jgi:hypothetical protein
MMRNTHLYLTTFTLLSSVWVTPILAGEGDPLLEKSKFSLGAGISNNSISGPVSDEIGYQFFGAYNLSQVNLMQGVNSSVEFGYMDYGFSGSDSSGIWATYVVDGKFVGNFGWLARLGLDFGDDNGLMLGVGLDYSVNSKMDLRGEYVIRDEVDSLQFNIIYNL